MKWLVIKITAAAFTFSIALGLGAVSHAQTIFQDFEGGTVMPATTFFAHPGGVAVGGGPLSGFDNLNNEGISGVAGFAGALGGDQGATIASLGLSATGGVGGSQAALLTLTNNTSTIFAFGGISQDIGFPISNPTGFIASVDVLAPAGFQLALRVESAFGAVNNGFTLDFVGTGSYETISGIVGTDLVANATGAFDFADPNPAIIVATRTGGTIPFGVNQEVFIDNLSLTPVAAAVPEPDALLALIGLGGIFATGRRRS